AVESDGPNYLIKNGENGFLIKYGDEKALVKYIEVLMKDKKTYNKICSNNIKKVKEFTWEKVAKKIMDVYEEVCR
ncbi:MAG: glycosyltransferase family 4 protein, partial [Candidatus Aenigmarchaeota archaeon]|nr:glycosyltransferase family 4 protein [Candidatus Aenigmarchaeota archaeon]